jgi:hypothetical protein
MLAFSSSTSPAAGSLDLPVGELEGGAGRALECVDVFVCQRHHFSDFLCHAEHTGKTYKATFEPLIDRRVLQGSI